MKLNVAEKQQQQVPVRWQEPYTVRPRWRGWMHFGYVAGHDVLFEEDTVVLQTHGVQSRAIAEAVVQIGNAAYNLGYMSGYSVGVLDTDRFG